MKIKNIDNYSIEEIRSLVGSGQAKFVIYKYCISIVIASFNNPTDVYFIPKGESGLKMGLKYLLVNLITGWWGIPWGPIHTLGNIGSILSGGKDITNEVMSFINERDPNYGTGNTYNIPGSNIQGSAGSNQYNVPSR